MGLCGDVRNCPDSTVEIVVEGTPPSCRNLSKQVGKGTSLSRVQRVDVIDVPSKAHTDRF